MYYVTAQNQENKQFVLSSIESTRILAQKDIRDQATLHGLIVELDQVRLVKGTGSQGRTNTKFSRQRRHTGSNGTGYERAL